MGWTGRGLRAILPDVKRALISVLLLVAMGCDVFLERRTEPRNANYPAERRDPPPDLHDRDENPQSQAWPLDRWLVEFENRNGVELKYREQDTFGHEVVQPAPGPFDTDQQALDALHRVCRRSGLTLVEVGPHVYKIKRLDGVK